MKVRELMTSRVKSCHMDASAEDAARVMWDCDCGVVPLVHDDGRLAGMVTDRDICMAAYFNGRHLSEISAISAGTREPIAVRESDGVGVAESLMAQHRIRRIPVVDADGMVVGILSLTDLIRHVSDASDGERPYSVVRTLYAISDPSPVATPAN